MLHWSQVNFKLYHDLGLSYPPSLDEALDASGAHLSAIVMQPAPSDLPAPRSVENSAPRPIIGGHSFATAFKPCLPQHIRNPKQPDLIRSPPQPVSPPRPELDDEILTSCASYD